MQKINQAIHENERLLMYYYNDSLSKIKQQILEAAESGHDTTHLKHIKANVEEEIAKLDKRFQYYSKQTISQTYKSGVEGSEADCKQLKIPFEPLKAKSYTQFGGIHKEAVAALAINTYKPLKRVVDIVGRDCLEYLERTDFSKTEEICKSLRKYFAVNEDLRKTGLASVRGVVNGNKTWANAMADFQKSFLDRNIFEVPYYKKDGSLHCMVRLADYAELVARTTSAEAFRQGATNQILETMSSYGDLVQINGHTKFPNSPCIPFENAILSLTGKTEGYMTIKEAKAQGLFHPNCIHHFSVTTDVMEEYDRIEEGKGKGTVLNKTAEDNSKTVKNAEPSKNLDNCIKFSDGEKANDYFYNSDTYKKWFENLSENQQEAFLAYTDNSDDVNKYCRKIGDYKDIGNIDLLKEQIQEMDNAINSFTLESPIQLVRGVNYNAFNASDLKELIGCDYTDPAFMSTSVTEKGSKASESDITMIIRIPSGKGLGAYINQVSVFENIEHEFLLARNSKFKITNVVSENGKEIVYMDLIK